MTNKENIVDPLFDTYLKTFAKTRANEVSTSPKINFVSTDIAIDFFEQGKKIGEQEFKRKVKENVEKRMAEQNKFTIEVVTQLFEIFKKNNYTIHKLYLSINIDCSKILLTVSEEQHYDQKFMNLFYPLASDLEDSYSKDGFQFHISALDESTNINVDLLKSDGYNFCYDIIKQQKLF